MAGSQLKQLKAALKSQGLIGQTNVKRKNKKSKTPSETRRNENLEALNGIRRQFNQFDTKVNRNKHDITTVKGKEFVKIGSNQYNEATRTNTNVKQQMKLAYEVEKSRKGRTGGIVDRRFGENDKNLSAEEIMLERFTRERQGSSKRKIDFALGSDDEDNDGSFLLTHSGKALSLDDDVSPNALGSSQSRFVDNEALMPQEAPVKRKSKNEVMKEIIAKSKFYKHQRQVEFQKVQDEIHYLDDDFSTVMGELNTSSTQKMNSEPLTKTQESIDYDSKVRELTYDRRSVPASRTKTEEEIKEEKLDNLRKLEADRERRMNADREQGEAQGDDLDDFWARSEDEEDVESLSHSDEESANEIETKERGRKVSEASFIMPATVKDLEFALNKLERVERIKKVEGIISAYHPRFAEGNKEKLGKFSCLLLEYLLNLDSSEAASYTLNHLLPILRTLGESHKDIFVPFVKDHLFEIHARKEDTSSFAKEDLLFFPIIGYVFSTSDHYHMVVTPAIIVMAEKIATFQYQPQKDLSLLGESLFLSDVLLTYQRLSQRYIPEVLCFLEKAYLLLLPKPQEILDPFSVSKEDIIDSNLAFDEDSVGIIEEPVSVSEINYNNKELRGKYLYKLLCISDKIISTWKDLSSFFDVLKIMRTYVLHLQKYTDSAFVEGLSGRIEKLLSNTARVPLQLQHHRAHAIVSQAPKFEENFNPDRKSYDLNRDRQELNKMKNLIKKEKKAALKDIRKQSKFAAGEQIKEKKAEYETYHRKMARIVNSISTVEGAEKNEYQREKKRRHQ